MLCSIYYEASVVIESLGVGRYIVERGNVSLIIGVVNPMVRVRFGVRVRTLGFTNPRINNLESLKGTATVSSNSRHTSNRYRRWQLQKCTSFIVHWNTWTWPSPLKTKTVVVVWVEFSDSKTIHIFLQHGRAIFSRGKANSRDLTRYFFYTTVRS